MSIKTFEQGAVPNNCTVQELIDYLLSIKNKELIVCRMLFDDDVFFSSIENIKIIPDSNYYDDGGETRKGNLLAIY
jgi:hypothetical protein